jgi:hypothetical protein
VTSQQQAMQDVEAINHYFQENQNTLRDYIGNRCYRSDGDHKEILVRKTLRRFLPPDIKVGRGLIQNVADIHPWQAFGRAHEQSLTEIDVIILRRGREPVFQIEDLLVVAPQDVAAIIEVKTSLRVPPSPRGHNQLDDPRYETNHRRGMQFAAAARKVARHASIIRSLSQMAGSTFRCWAGLFIYNEPRAIRDRKDHVRWLESLVGQEVQSDDDVIDCVCFGPNLFAHYWSNAQYQVEGLYRGAAYHSYDLNGFAMPYLINNALFHVRSEYETVDEDVLFPIPGGKEQFRKFFLPHDQHVAQAFF